MKKIIIFLFCLIILTIPSSAQQTFKDVIISDNCYESVEYLANEKIISGIGNSYFFA